MPPVQFVNRASPTFDILLPAPALLTMTGKSETLRVARERLALTSVTLDHYATLGLDRGCTTAQIRAAYRQLAKRHHPDLNPGSDEAVGRSRQLNAAHEVLSDPVRRGAYDREVDARSSPAARVRGEKIERNLSHDVHVRIEDLIRGVSMEIRVKDPANPHGSETYRLDIPPESAPGLRVRLPRVPPFADGFVQVRVRVRPGFRFKARGTDLRCDLRIDARRATQGGTELIAGATGAPLRVPIPAGVPRGTIVRIAGEGLPKPRGGRGDLLVRITYRPEIRARVLK